MVAEDAPSFKKMYSLFASRPSLSRNTTGEEALNRDEAASQLEADQPPVARSPPLSSPDPISIDSNVARKLPVDPSLDISAHTALPTQASDLATRSETSKLVENAPKRKLKIAAAAVPAKKMKQSKLVRRVDSESTIDLSGLDEEDENLPAPRKNPTRAKQKNSAKRNSSPEKLAEEEDSETDERPIKFKKKSNTSAAIQSVPKIATGDSNPFKIESNSSRKSKKEILGEITIPDSPPITAHKAFTSSFAPLSESYRRSRETRKANEVIWARWPTAEEHAHRKIRTQPAGWNNSLETRWTSRTSAQPAYQTARDDNDSLMQLATFDSDFTKSRKISISPQTEQIPLSSLKSLVPKFPPHPLLERLATQFLNQVTDARNLRRAWQRNDEIGSSDFQAEKELWTTKFAPETAEEVLGTLSGQSAKILKRWLIQQSLTDSTNENDAENFLPRRQIFRQPKARKKLRTGIPSDLEDFIADEDEEIQQEFVYDANSSEVEFDADDSRALFPTLSNLILLAGPTASGKTSSVHACAHELGWQVFELYPGIGKRGSKEIEKLVGDVGRNHLVRPANANSSPVKNNSRDLYSMFSKNKPTEASTSDTAEREEIYGKQCLILFDEVDVLFRDDKDFWPGLIDLVRDCRRPVVMTCNDFSQIPFSQLALQIISQNSIQTNFLTFAAPEIEFAAPFLNLIGLNQGIRNSQASIENLYSQECVIQGTPNWLIECTASGSLDLLHPNSEQTLNAGNSQPDLRRAMNQLQFQSQWPTAVNTLIPDEFMTNWLVNVLPPTPAALTQAGNEEIESNRLEILAQSRENLSFLNSLVERRLANRIEEFDRGPALNLAAQEEFDFPALNSLPSPEQIFQLPEFGREAEIARSIEALGHGSAQRLQELHAETVEQSLICLRNTAKILFPDELVTCPAPLLPHTPIFVDYMPFIRLITLADDVHAAEDVSQVTSTEFGLLKVTRRSQRLSAGNVYQRKLEWTQQQAELVHESNLWAV